MITGVVNAVNLVKRTKISLEIKLQLIKSLQSFFYSVLTDNVDNIKMYLTLKKTK